jgi:O-antigen ligase
MIAAYLWPLVLLAPFVPGLPRPINGGLTWRQEALLGALLSVSQGVAAYRLWAAGAPRGRRPRGAESVLLAALVAFAAWSAASLFWAANSFAALHHTASWGCYILFFLVMRRAAKRPRLLRASLEVFTLVVLAIAAANCLGHWTTPNSLIRQNGLGEPVAVSVPIFAALALGLRGRRAALVCGATASVAWLSTLQIAERAPFVGVSVGLLLLAAASAGAARFRPRSARRAALLAAAFALAAALQFAPSPFSKTVHQPLFARLRATSPAEENTRARLLFWGAALEMFRARPLAGVGAGGYDAAFPEARAAFSERHADSPLVGVNENFLTGRAHNEYLQILAELGAVGLALFVAACSALVWLAAAALRRARGPLVPGAIASLAAFAVSSGASSISFRWTSSGLVFFFAAALVARFASAARAPDDVRGGPVPALLPALPRGALLAGLTCALASTAVMCAHGANVLLQASAQATADEGRAEKLYRAALGLNPLDPAAHFNYGIWLLARKREREAADHLRYAVRRGFNTSTCYEYLAGAESNAGDLEGAEQTLAFAARVYPRSVFLRARHASALERVGRARDAELEMSAALLLDSRAARGWRRLIDEDIDAAIAEARRDPAVPMPGELRPEDAVLAVLQENERRFPEAVTSGWRARVRSTVLR